jgi:hypothetical protein
VAATDWVNWNGSGCHPLVQFIQTLSNVVLDWIDFCDVSLLGGPSEVSIECRAKDVAALNKHHLERLELGPAYVRACVCVCVCVCVCACSCMAMHDAMRHRRVEWARWARRV